MTGTVTFSRLGDWGQFANQLFQISVVLGYAARHGAEPRLPPWRCAMTGVDYEAWFPGIRRYVGDAPEATLYQEPGFPYAEIPPAEHIDLRGNFQCERYFAHVAPDIRALFAEPPAIAAELDAYIRDLGLGAFAALHMRFYAHPTRDKGKGPMEALPLAYTQRALAALGSDLPIVVATDNHALLDAALRIIRPEGRIIVSDRTSHLADFFLLARARRIAISNSSFSWWAAWLGGAKERVLAPHRYYWFNRDVRHDPFWNPRDLYPRQFREIAW